MKKIGIFYGSSSGNTQHVAELIAEKLNVAKTEVIDVAKATADRLLNYDLLLLGSSTWGLGDLQDDWEGFIEQLKKANLSGKQVAIFGTGDSSSYPDSFCDAIGIIAEAAEKAGAAIIGKGVPSTDYSFDESMAAKNGTFCGLPIDEDNESNKTEERVTRWVQQIKTERTL